MTIDLEEAASFRKNVTGIDHTIFISPHGIAVALDPDSLDPRDAIATITYDGAVIGEIDPQLARQVRQFIDANRTVLEAYSNYEIDTNQLQQLLQQRVQPIAN